MAAQIDQSKQATKDLLLADYKYFSELLLTNEQSGETRVNWFIVIVSSAIAGIIALVVKHAEQVAAYKASLQNFDPTKVVPPPALTSNQIRLSNGHGGNGPKFRCHVASNQGTGGK